MSLTAAEELDLMAPMGPPRPTKRLERYKEHQKYFLKDGTQVPGASTIANIGADKEGIIYWAWDCGRKGINYRDKKQQAADIGTIAHFMIECEIQGFKPDLGDFSQNDIDAARVPYESAMDWWNAQGLIPIAAELQLVSEHYGYGGTLDMPCRNRHSELVLLDWKTSKKIYPEQISQVSGYENLLEEHFHERVSQRAIVRVGKDGSFEVRWLGALGGYFNVFKAQLALYNAKLAIA